jgi:hypothetical protein
MENEFLDRVELINDLMQSSDISPIYKTSTEHILRLLERDKELTRMEILNLAFLGNLVQGQFNRDNINKYTKEIVIEQDKDLLVLCDQYIVTITQGAIGEIYRLEIHNKIADYFNIERKDTRLIEILHNLDKYIEFDGEKYLKKYGKRLYKLLLKEFN